MQTAECVQQQPAVIQDLAALRSDMNIETPAEQLWGDVFMAVTDEVGGLLAGRVATIAENIFKKYVNAQSYS